MKEYKPPFFIRGAHLETLYPHFFRKVKQRAFEALTFSTPDQDFLEADYYNANNKTLVILSHGLEGDSRRDYMLGMTNLLLDNNYDVICWNYRGCGPTINKQPRLYHSGATDDLDVVVQEVIKMGYKSIVLTGFSLGGNLTLKYCGERGEELDPRIKAAIAISTPLDLDAGCAHLSRPQNRLYSYRFISRLKLKTRKKHQQFPDIIKLDGIDKIKDLRTFDDRYTAPIHGFRDASDYYEKCSSINFVGQIQIPTLIINAKNDPFLPDQCYPYELLGKNPHIIFETPEHGGHVGFTQWNHNGAHWSDMRALKFINNVLGSN